MIINPNIVVFESTNDVIDYVTRGLPPSKKNFEAVMYKFNHPDNKSVIPSTDAVNIYRMDIDDETSREIISDIITRTYRNRIHNRNMCITAVGIVTAGIIVGSIIGSSKKDDKDDKK